MTGSIDLYRKEMRTHLPERDDVKLLEYHKLAVKRVKAKDIEREAFREAFMDIIDSNWESLKAVCRATLKSMENEIFFDETEVRGDNYWSQVKKLSENYHAEIGKSLRSRMEFIRLEYLDKRQAEDFEIQLLETQLIDANDSDAIPDTRVSKELELRMTWGRVIIFWQCWNDCRMITIEILNSILDVFEGQKEKKKHLNPEEIFLKKIFKQDDLDKFLLLFAHTVNEDLSCYEVLHRKLAEFMKLVSSKDILDAFDVEPKDLFFNTSNFQDCISTKQSESYRPFEICENIVSRRRDGIGDTSISLACTSRPLLHLKDFLKKLSDKGSLCQVGIKDVIKEIRQEDTDISKLFSESLEIMVSNAAQQLQEALREWLPKREASIKTMNEIIQKLNKTTKDVAITRTVSSTVGIAGGITMIVGLVLIPFTGGASLIPTAIAGGIASGLGATTGIGAAVANIVIDKGQIEQATKCIEDDKIHVAIVTKAIEKFQQSFTLLLRYIPQDELESFLSVRTDPQSAAMLRNASKFHAGTQIAMNAVKGLSSGGSAIAGPVSKLLFKGSLAASNVAFRVAASSLAAVGVGLDIVNLALATVSLLKGAKSASAKNLEDVVKKMEEEKGIFKGLIESVPDSG